MKGYVSETNKYVIVVINRYAMVDGIDQIIIYNRYGFDGGCYYMGGG